MDGASGLPSDTYPAPPSQIEEIDEIAENHEAYTGEGKIPASPAIRALLR